ncbi:MFS transporter [Streptomyces sp. NPDC059104]|uniref:MFS transporter n=1 Tax=Streptomyces sp. NPDC059104 TaxID=3346729 RepID=UPI00368C93C2
MSSAHPAAIDPPGASVPPRGLVAVLTAAAFLVFAQAFMIAPILPQLARAFHSTPGTVGLAVPAYLVPCGAMTLVWGPLSDRIGRRPVILAPLAAFTVSPPAPPSPVVPGPSSGCGRPPVSEPAEWCRSPSP